VVLLFFAVVMTVEGQACVPYHGSPATGGKCDSVVTYPNVLLLPTKPYAKVVPLALALHATTLVHQISLCPIKTNCRLAGRSVAKPFGVTCAGG
jgi:hypothetical protein